MTQNKPYLLALDQGTTSSRAIVFDKKGKIISTSQKEFKQHFPKQGWVEHDPEEIWKSQSKVMIDALVEEGIRSRSDCRDWDYQSAGNDDSLG